MTEQEKINLLEEMFEVDPGTIKSETSLDNLSWDSMSYLSLIALVNEHFGKRLTATQLKSFRTIQDILDVME